MEKMGIDSNFWRGKNVFITGHTGFKGGWLSLWLSELGANVFGYSLPPKTTPSFFDVTNIADHIKSHTIADICDLEAIKKSMQSARPEIVFHLAAQPLVLESYAFPVETYAVNVMGTVNLLEAVRVTKSVRAVLNITTDKCYENQELSKPFNEGDPLGGYDPYSSSKACSELVTSAYRNSFIKPPSIGLASARSGNVVGGGDWSMDRLIPDFFRAVEAGKPLMIRNPKAVRPWQHVLEPLSGYLMLAQRLAFEPDFSQAWNFGPTESDARSVGWVADELARHLESATWQSDQADYYHEANFLMLDSSKARKILEWAPRWHLSVGLEKTASWHEAWREGLNMYEYSLSQIHAYMSRQ